MNKKEARKDSFIIYAETCPAVDRIMINLDQDIYRLCRHLEDVPLSSISKCIDSATSDIKIQTEGFRDALTNSILERSNVEDQLSFLEEKYDRTDYLRHYIKQQFHFETITQIYNYSLFQ